LGTPEYTDYACNRKKHITGACDVEERYGNLFTIQRKRAGHKACWDGSLATSVRKDNFTVKVVVLQCCEKTLCLVTAEITGIVNSGQTQRKYKSGAAKRKHRVEQAKRDEQIKKKVPCLLT